MNERPTVETSLEYRQYNCKVVTLTSYDQKVAKIPFIQEQQRLTNVVGPQCCYTTADLTALSVN